MCLEYSKINYSKCFGVSVDPKHHTVCKKKEATMSDDDKVKRLAICKDCGKQIPAEEYQRYGGYCSFCAQKQNVLER